MREPVIRGNSNLEPTDRRLPYQKNLCGLTDDRANSRASAGRSVSARRPGKTAISPVCGIRFKRIDLVAAQANELRSAFSVRNSY